MLTDIRVRDSGVHWVVACLGGQMTQYDGVWISLVIITIIIIIIITTTIAVIMSSC